MATAPMTSCSLVDHTAVHQHVSDCATRCPSRRAQLVEHEARRVADIAAPRSVVRGTRGRVRAFGSVARACGRELQDQY